MMDISFLEGAALVMTGAAAGYGIWWWRDRSFRGALKLKEEGIIQNAEREADNLIREARLKANEETLKIREETERKFAERRQILAEAESRIAQREALVNAQLASLTE